MVILSFMSTKRVPWLVGRVSHVYVITGKSYYNSLNIYMHRRWVSCITYQHWVQHWVIVITECQHWYHLVLWSLWSISGFSVWKQSQVLVQNYLRVYSLMFVNQHMNLKPYFPCVDTFTKFKRSGNVCASCPKLVWFTVTLLVDTFTTTSVVLFFTSCKQGHATIIIANCFPYSGPLLTAPLHLCVYPRTPA